MRELQGPDRVRKLIPGIDHEARVRALAGDLKRNPQRESAVRHRSMELGVARGSSLDQVMKAPAAARGIARAIGLGLERGMER